MPLSVLGSFALHKVDRGGGGGGQVFNQQGFEEKNHGSAIVIAVPARSKRKEKIA